MKSPTLYCLRQLDDLIQTGPQRQLGSEWVPARPIGLSGFRNRLSCAWRVFTGTADAVIWPEDGANIFSVEPAVVRTNPMVMIKLAQDIERCSFRPLGGHDKAKVLIHPVPVVGDVWKGNKFGDMVKITASTAHGFSCSDMNGKALGSRSRQGFLKNFSLHYRA